MGQAFSDLRFSGQEMYLDLTIKHLIISVVGLAKLVPPSVALPAKLVFAKLSQAKLQLSWLALASLNFT